MTGTNQRWYAMRSWSSRTWCKMHSVRVILILRVPTTILRCLKDWFRYKWCSNSKFLSTIHGHSKRNIVTDLGFEPGPFYHEVKLGQDLSHWLNIRLVGGEDQFFLCLSEYFYPFQMFTGGFGGIKLHLGFIFYLNMEENIGVCGLVFELLQI